MGRTLYYIKRSMNIACVVHLAAMARGGVRGTAFLNESLFISISVNFLERSRVGLDVAQVNLTDIMMVFMNRAVESNNKIRGKNSKNIFNPVGKCRTIN